ncbi:MAG TPA: outer membrane beta-barrel protein, partial [Blastocatellia bacterium]
QTGINTSVKLSDHWLVQAGLSAGCEATPWTKAPDAKPTFNACVGYYWDKGRDDVYLCDNSTNSGKYAYNNLQAYYATWYHKFDDKWHIATEYWYMWEKDVPSIFGPIPAEVNADGAYCASGELTCYAPEQAIVNYVERKLTDHDEISIRNEFFDDEKGQRTGFKSKYTEHMVSWGHFIGTTVILRPEIRFEHSYDMPAYDSGTKKNQLMLAGDVVFRY